MRKLIVLFLLVATILSAATSCSKADKSYLDKWSESEIEVMLNGGYNDFSYALPDEMLPYYTDSNKSASKARNQKRADAYYKSNPIGEIEYVLKEIGERPIALALKNVTVREKLRKYQFVTQENDVSVTLDAKTMNMISYNCYPNGDTYKSIVDKNKSEDNRIVENLDEAIEYAKKFIIDNLTYVDDIDLFELKYANANLVPEEPTWYEIDFYRYYKGIRLSSISVIVSEYFGVDTLHIDNCDRDTVDFYIACIDYALTDEVQTKLMESFDRALELDNSIVDIKNIKPFDNGIKENVETSLTRSYTRPYYAGIEYNDILDRTSVVFSFDYTIVMQDGTEKDGKNTVSVLIPVDWAAEFGEKTQASFQ